MLLCFLGLLCARSGGNAQMESGPPLGRYEIKKGDTLTTVFHQPGKRSDIALILNEFPGMPGELKRVTHQKSFDEKPFLMSIYNCDSAETPKWKFGSPKECLREQYLYDAQGKTIKKLYFRKKHVIIRTKTWGPFWKREKEDHFDFQ